MFQSSSAFNGDLSKWQISSVTTMQRTFYDAKAFSRKADLDIAWEASNSDVYPGPDMFNGTCSATPDCGKCSKKNADGDAVSCLSETQPAKDPSIACIFCLNDGYECCTRTLPNGNGAQREGRTGDTLGRIVDDWTDESKRYAIEAIYGPIGDWNVSLVKNFGYLFHAANAKTAFNADISKWDTASAENMYASEC
jgi:surface protein